MRLTRDTRWFSVSGLILLIHVFLVIYLGAHVLHSCAFCWWFHLKWPPNILLKCLVVLSTRLWHALWMKYVLHKLHSCTGYAAFGCEFNINKSITYIKQVFLSKETHIKQGCVLLGWQKFVTGGWHEPTSVSCRSNGLVFTNSVSANVYRTWAR